MNKVILCIKWGNMYSADYVNVLASAAKKHLSEPFRFVCLTDDPTGLSQDVEHFPIPDMGLASGNYTFGAWPKISMFEPDLYGLTGRALFIDLDSMICGDLAPMFEIENNIVMIKEWPRPIDHLKVNKPVRGASGVISFELGTMGHVYDSLVSDPERWTSEIRNDQRFMWKMEKDIGFWPDEWVISFKRHLLPLPIVNRFVPPKSPPETTRILAFHGRPRPLEVVPDKNQVWGDFWRAGRGAVPWFREYWLENGGRDV